MLSTRQSEVPAGSCAHPLLLLLLISVKVCCGNSLFPSRSPRCCLRVFSGQMGAAVPVPGMTYTRSEQFPFVSITWKKGTMILEKGPLLGRTTAPSRISCT